MNKGRQLAKERNNLNEQGHRINEKKWGKTDMNKGRE